MGEEWQNRRLHEAQAGVDLAQASLAKLGVSECMEKYNSIACLAKSEANLRGDVVILEESCKVSCTIGSSQDSSKRRIHSIESDLKLAKVSGHSRFQR